VTSRPARAINGSHMSVSRTSNLALIGDSRWPQGWRARAYRLQLEAEEAGATQAEIESAGRWMLDPEIPNAWSHGRPTNEQLRELAVIELGVRAWLRARGRMLRAEA
jgi:hypothetical protein